MTDEKGNGQGPAQKTLPRRVVPTPSEGLTRGLLDLVAQVATPYVEELMTKLDTRAELKGRALEGNLQGQYDSAVGEFRARAAEVARRILADQLGGSERALTSALTNVQAIATKAADNYKAAHEESTRLGSLATTTLQTFERLRDTVSARLSTVETSQTDHNSINRGAVAQMRNEIEGFRRRLHAATSATRSNEVVAREANTRAINAHVIAASARSTVKTYLTGTDGNAPLLETMIERRLNATLDRLLAGDVPTLVTVDGSVRIVKAPVRGREFVTKLLELAGTAAEHALAGRQDLAAATKALSENTALQQEVIALRKEVGELVAIIETIRTTGTTATKSDNKETVQKSSLVQFAPVVGRFNNAVVLFAAQLAENDTDYDGAYAALVETIELPEEVESENTIEVFNALVTRIAALGTHLKSKPGEESNHRASLDNAVEPFEPSEIEDPEKLTAALKDRLNCLNAAIGYSTINVDRSSFETAITELSG